MVWIESELPGSHWSLAALWRNSIRVVPGTRGRWWWFESIFRYNQDSPGYGLCCLVCMLGYVFKKRKVGKAGGTAPGIPKSLLAICAP